VSQTDGNAVVEFTLVTVLLLTMFLALLQLALALHIRNTLVAAAGDGARYAANANRDPEHGADRTRQQIRDVLADRFANGVSAGHETVDGLATVYVQVRTTLPLIGVLGPSRGLTVRAHAVEEG
jgi:Flp pilus assembly protein TadG